MRIWKEGKEIFVEGLLVDYSDEFEKERGITRESISGNVDKIKSGVVPILLFQNKYFPYSVNGEFGKTGWLIDCEDKEEGFFVRGKLFGWFWESLASQDELDLQAKISYGFRQKGDGSFDLVSAEVTSIQSIEGVETE